LLKIKYKFNKPNLFQNGITKQDIPGISKLVELYSNNTEDADSSSAYCHNYQNKNQNNTIEGG
jgi:hypothetical protein